jgi:hypothetical protein
MVFLIHNACNFPTDVPPGLAQVFDLIALEACAPDVFHGIAQAKVHVLSNLDALHTRWM